MKKFLRIFSWILILCGTGFVFLIIQIYSQSMTDEAQKADAIVVLGASQWSGQPSPVFKARLDHALRLYQNNYAHKIILTGGIGEGEVFSESYVGKSYLVQHGVAKQNVFIEEDGHTSWQSLNQVAQILKELSLYSTILVSDGFHIMRLKKMAQDLKFTSYASSAQESRIDKDKFSKFKYVLREACVYILYLLFKV